jgi:hypothetical protein
MKERKKEQNKELFENEINEDDRREERNFIIPYLSK